MKIRLSVFALASLFTTWLAASYFSQCVAEDYPGLSISSDSENKVAEQSELPAEAEEPMNQLVSTE